ncbi:unnamed protein product [Ceutorhynchus assimilis]|uniref:mRNA cap guanine-N(7) methyltransferase n=1 Tax=Ceutorhynchus assimilis TaxID=467358 RepID=A0A9N9MS65_9CUCU|nr:unnamed protein product [Ceutorhynchus assimilis]
MSENADDLEQTLMLAAAAADSRQYEEEQRPGSVSPEPQLTSNASTDISYYNSTKDPEEVTNKANENTTDYESSPVSKPSRTKKKLEDVKDEKPVRKHIKTDYDDSCSPHNNKLAETASDSSHAQVVATHYNLIEEKGLDERSKSRIVHMRNFHNWIKSMLINEYLTKIKDSKKQHNPPIRVHDMCCGKGGDLQKWKIGNITHLICSDIAEVSLEHCKQRYADMKRRSQNDRRGNIFSMEIVPGDAGKIRLREKYKDPSIKLDLVSCQFAFHYSFESLSQAECMMKNASECLLPGGFFIGTMPDSNEIIARAKKSSITGSFGNAVLEVSLEFDVNKPPLFGGKYNFQLDGVVNCPEFLVHFPVFVKLAKKFGLKLVKKEKFMDFFERVKNEGRQLLTNMRALESYPPNEGCTLVGDASGDYLHAEEFVQKEARDSGKIGTLSKSEWEVSSLYLTFVFEKVKSTWNADGTPCYDI